ncbi:hypothetical protein B0H13DRAFT_1887040 [Mycena leptocephala]|nr:hypothetical protein B0H13DRAFT_1887040 [Mycena leptocephala]
MSYGQGESASLPNAVIGDEDFPAKFKFVVFYYLSKPAASMYAKIEMRVAICKPSDYNGNKGCIIYEVPFWRAGRRRRRLQRHSEMGDDICLRELDYTDAPPPTAAAAPSLVPKTALEPKTRPTRPEAHARTFATHPRTHIPDVDRNAHPTAPATHMHAPRRPPSTARALSPSATSPAGTPAYEGADSLWCIPPRRQRRGRRMAARSAAPPPHRVKPRNSSGVPQKPSQSGCRALLGSDRRTSSRGLFGQNSSPRGCSRYSSGVILGTAKEVFGHSYGVIRALYYKKMYDYENTKLYWRGLEGDQTQ